MGTFFIYHIEPYSETKANFLKTRFSNKQRPLLV